MTWSYSGNPQTDQIDEVRHLCGDTVKIEISLSNEEIAYMIVQKGKGYPAAIASCLALAARASALADEVTGEVEVKWSQRARAFYKLAEQLQHDFNGTNGTKAPEPFGGGTSVSDMLTRNSNPDRVPTRFSIGGFDNNQG
jgi:hypothetical protein